MCHACIVNNAVVSLVKCLFNYLPYFDIEKKCYEIYNVNK